MAFVKTIIRLEGKFKDIDRRLFTYQTERLIFVKRAGESGTKWYVVHEPVKGWSVSFDDYRMQARAAMNTSAVMFRDIIAQSSHFAWGNMVGGKIDMYEIAADQRDVVPPDGNSPDWKVYGTRDPKERYTAGPPPPVIPEGEQTWEVIEW